MHSLSPPVDDDGVSFTSVLDGSAVRLTPESAVEIQGLIGADIQMVLDVCATLPADPETLRVAVERTAAWAARARDRHRHLESRPEAQALFGIVQGARTRSCAKKAPAGRSSWTSTATASVASRWASPARPCWPRWLPPFPSCR